MEEALYLTKFASRVVLVHRREEFRASKIMSLRASKNPKITTMLSRTVDEILGDGQKVTGIRLKNVETGELEDHECDGVFMAIGHAPNAQIFTGQIETDDYGYIITKNPQLKPMLLACLPVVMFRTIPIRQASYSSWYRVYGRLLTPNDSSSPSVRYRLFYKGSPTA